MTGPFVFTETDLTKSKWLAIAYHDFVEEMRRPSTTFRGLFYYALQRKASDYPICGGFVGEIRITRPYHECDGEKLPKWINKAITLGFIPANTILDEIHGEHIYFPRIPRKMPCTTEVWVNKSALNPLLFPICEKHGVTLVSVNINASEKAVKDLHQRLGNPTINPTTILCLSDLNQSGAFFAQDLAMKIENARPPKSNADIRLKSIALLPEQVLEMKIPMVAGKSNSKENKDKFKKYLKSYSLDHKKMAELDALEVYYPGGVAGFLDNWICKYNSNSDSENEYSTTDYKKECVIQNIFRT